METIDRFWNKVDKTDTCWLWNAYISPKGYGRITVNYKPQMAHRWSYEYFIGKIPDGLVLDHLCNTKRCVNPEHLEPVTNKENLARGEVGKKNAEHHRAKTHCKNRHEYTLENTEYWNRLSRGVLTRRCKTCYDKQQERHKSKNKRK